MVIYEPERQVIQRVGLLLPCQRNVMVLGQIDHVVKSNPRRFERAGVGLPWNGVDDPARVPRRTEAVIKTAGAGIGAIKKLIDRGEPGRFVLDLRNEAKLLTKPRRVVERLIDSVHERPPRSVLGAIFLYRCLRADLLEK